MCFCQTEICKMQNLNLLINELISLPTETEWLEFKHNNFNPQMIGEDISALANSAAYRGKDKAYMIWGINNETHEIVGTNYNRFSKLEKNQEIESWLKNSVSKNAGSVPITTIILALSIAFSIDNLYAALPSSSNFTLL